MRIAPKPSQRHAHVKLFDILELDPEDWMLPLKFIMKPAAEGTQEARVNRKRSDRQRWCWAREAYEGHKPSTTLLAFSRFKAELGSDGLLINNVHSSHAGRIEP
jgi:hypothetical protein